MNLIWILGLQMIVLVLFGGLCGSLNNVFVHMTGQNIGNEMHKDCFRNIMAFSLPQMDRFGTGSLVTRVTNDITQVQNFVAQFVRGMIRTTMLTFGSIFFMFRLNNQFGLIVLCAFPFIAGCLAFCLSRANPLFSRLQAQLDQINAIMQEDVSGIRTDVFSGIMGPIMNCIGNIGFVIIAAFGGYFAANQWISVGVISAFIVYAKQFSKPINEIAQIYGQLQTAIAGAERVFTVLDEAGEDMGGEPLREEGNAAISFDHVNFSYEPGHPVIRDFSLRVPSGKKVALVGATGSGKTTIINLLMRFYETDSGEIRIDGQNIAGVSRDSLRKNMAIVLQDTVLFSDTIRNNLLYANESAAQEQLDEAVRMSRCGEMLKLLPHGYETYLTAGGTNISQGQRQLLAIARAFVADPRILILDEATSNVDTRTEKAIQSAMQQVMQNRTSIIIAHRLSTIQDADWIVVMDQGRIVESGSHETLLEKKGRYYDLYRTQYAGFAT